MPWQPVGLPGGGVCSGGVCCGGVCCGGVCSGGISCFGGPAGFVTDVVALAERSALSGSAVVDVAAPVTVTEPLDGYAGTPSLSVNVDSPGARLEAVHVTVPPAAPTAGVAHVQPADAVRLTNR